MADEFDYIIIGAGSAGSILANRLSAGDATVCLLEAGPPDRNPWIHIPAGFTRTLANPKVNWLFESEPSEGTAGRPVYVPRGKTLGGSSSINGHIYNRGQRMDYDSWAQEGNRGWGYADILPYFKRGERRIGGPEQTGDEDFHGRDGELPVTDIDGPEPICDAFIDGAVGIGIPRNDDYNGATQAGVGYFQRVIENGRRVSAARAFLHPVKHRPNLDIRTNAHTQRILFDGARAVGVLYKKGDQTIELRARQEIILSSGSVGSPQLLQISGVGPAALLKDLGVEVVHDLLRRESLAIYLDRGFGRNHDAVAGNILDRRANGGFGAVVSGGVEIINAEVDGFSNNLGGVFHGFPRPHAQSAVAATSQTGDADAQTGFA